MRRTVMHTSADSDNHERSAPNLTNVSKEVNNQLLMWDP